MASNKLKICFISPYFYPLKGGVENNCLNMALQAAAEGHDVTVYTSDRRFGVIAGRKFEIYEGIKIHRLRRWFFDQYYLSFLPSLPWMLANNQYDVVHTHVPGMIWTELSLIFKKLLHPKTVFINTPHDPFMSRSNYSTFSSLLKQVYQPFLRYYYAWLYNYVIAVQINQTEWIKKLYEVKDEQIKVVMNGVEDQLLMPVEIDSSVAKQYELENKVVITMIGRYHEYKGHQHILEAIKSIPNRKQLGIKYIGIGVDSGYLKRYQNYIVDNKLGEYAQLIENPNDLIRDQILAQTDIFILASRSEAFGISILEAMAKGAAIISTTTEGGLFLVGKENGLLYNFGDVKALANHIVELAENKVHREKLGEYNKIYAQQFSWGKVYKPYSELLAQISAAE